MISYLTNQNNRQFSQATFKIILIFIKIIQMNTYGWYYGTIVFLIISINNSFHCGINYVNISRILIILN